MIKHGKVNPKPLVFVFLTNGEQFIQLAHGFGPMALESDDHPCNGDLGCFISERLMGHGIPWCPTTAGTHLHYHTADMAEPFITIRTAADGAIKNGCHRGSPSGQPKIAHHHHAILPPYSTGVGALFPGPVTDGQRSLCLHEQKAQALGKRQSSSMHKGPSPPHVQQP